MKLTEIIFICLLLGMILVACNSGTSPAVDSKSPTARATLTNDQFFDINQQVQFDASDSTDNDDNGEMIVEYSWDWQNDGTFDFMTSDPQAVHSYSTYGYHNVQLLITDNENETDTLDIPLTANIVGSSVFFADADVEEQVREQIGMPDGILNQADLTNIDILTLRQVEINSVDFLLKWPGLDSLILHICEFDDISLLEDLVWLRGLTFTHSELTDASFVENLSNLEYLDLRKNEIEDVSVLSGLLELSHLNLAYNNITDLSPLLDNPGLGEGDVIDIHENQLDDYSKNVVIPELRARGIEFGWLVI